MNKLFDWYRMKKYKYTFLVITLILFPILSQQVTIDFSASNNLRQSYNDCALYSIKAVVNILLKKDVAINEIRKNIKERMKNNYTLPWGVEKYLEKSNVKIKTINYFYLKDSDKIKNLHEILSKKHPIIMLVGLGQYQHYITLLGYSGKYFFVYDSAYKKYPKNKNLTIDDNGDLPGNRNIKNDELIKMWNKGGMFGLYKNYGIECYK